MYDYYLLILTSKVETQHGCSRIAKQMYIQFKSYYDITNKTGF